MLYHNYNHYTVPTSQSEVTVMQLDNNPSTQDESCQVEHTNGMLKVHMHVCLWEQ